MQLCYACCYLVQTLLGVASDVMFELPPSLEDQLIFIISMVYCDGCGNMAIERKRKFIFIFRRQSLINAMKLVI